MREEIKAEWVDALRSGDYTQCHETLANDSLGSHCVFGVLAEMAAKRRICIRETNQAGLVKYDGSFTVLPPSVKEWAGIDDDEIQVCEPNGSCEYSLYELNDSGTDFDDLADIIEDQL
jgi:hypothetical protein